MRQQDSTLGYSHLAAGTNTVLLKNDVGELTQ